MIILAAGVLLFALLHGVAAIPQYKDYIKSRTGETWYGPVFGLASLFAIAVMVLGGEAQLLRPFMILRLGDGM